MASRSALATHSLSPFCELVVKDLDFYRQPRIHRILQKHLVQKIPLGFQFLPILILIVRSF